MSFLSSSCISSLSCVQVSGRMCYRSVQTSYSSGTLLDGGILASHSSLCVGRHSSLLYHIQSHHGCFSAIGLKCLALLPLTLWLLRDVHCADKGSLPQCKVVTGQLKHIQQQLSALLKGMGSLVCLSGCTIQCYLFLFFKFHDFLVYLYRVRLAWCTIGIYWSGISSFWNLIFITRLHIILSSVN